jgi:hypothetical protein
MYRSISNQPSRHRVPCLPISSHVQAKRNRKPLVVNVYNTHRGRQDTVSHCGKKPVIHGRSDIRSQRDTTLSAPIRVASYISRIIPSIAKRVNGRGCIRRSHEARRVKSLNGIMNGRRIQYKQWPRNMSSAKLLARRDQNGWKASTFCSIPQLLPPWQATDISRLELIAPFNSVTRHISSLNNNQSIHFTTNWIVAFFLAPLDTVVHIIPGKGIASASSTRKRKRRELEKGDFDSGGGSSHFPLHFVRRSRRQYPITC